MANPNHPPTPDQDILLKVLTQEVATRSETPDGDLFTSQRLQGALHRSQELAGDFDQRVRQLVSFLLQDHFGWTLATSDALAVHVVRVLLQNPAMASRLHAILETPGVPA